MWEQILIFLVGVIIGIIGFVALGFYAYSKGWLGTGED